MRSHITGSQKSLGLRGAVPLGDVLFDVLIPCSCPTPRHLSPAHASNFMVVNGCATTGGPSAHDLAHASFVGVLLQVAQALAGLRADMTADAEAVHANFVQQLMAGRRDAAAAIAQEHSELAAELQALGQQLNAALAGQQAKLTALVQADVHQVGRAGPHRAVSRALGSCSGVLSKPDAALAGQQVKPTALVLADVHQVGRAGPLVSKVQVALGSRTRVVLRDALHWVLAGAAPCRAAKQANLLPGRQAELCRATCFQNSPHGAAFELLCISLAQCSKPS